MRLTKKGIQILAEVAAYQQKHAAEYAELAELEKEAAADGAETVHFELLPETGKVCLSDWGINPFVASNTGLIPAGLYCFKEDGDKGHACVSIVSSLLPWAEEHRKEIMDLLEAMTDKEARRMVCIQGIMPLEDLVRLAKEEAAQVTNREKVQVVTGEK